MKIFLLNILVIVIIGTIIISGCSNNSPPVNTQPTTTGVAATMSGTSTNDAKMDSLVREKLQGCHSIDRVLNAKKTPEEWNTTLDRMISYGAIITPDEKSQIINWLVARNN
jgi:hypothetical protein